ncbi:hypothetical protein HYU12_00950, partial [Candidatus Woesearchaeota archaeon]|nr:hypothetical protein [Candidatus Woesearchaeota archaeon]
YLADAISYFQQGVEAIRSGNITLAGGEFQTALTRIEEMESELANLDDAERELRLRIRDVYDNDAKKNLILARAGVH